MAKNNRKNNKGLDTVLDALNKIEVATVVENIEAIQVSELTKEMVEEKLESLKDKVVEMHDNMEVCLESDLIEDANVIHTNIIVTENEIVNMEDRLNMFEEIKIEEVIEERNEMMEMIKGAIRYAVKQGAVEYTKMVEQNKEIPKFVSGKQIQAIVKNYKLRTDVEMTTEQVNWLKTLNPIQIEFIGITLNKARKLALA